jgi:pimeloyl-ACP methyl ester carboxylesterase
MPFPYLNETLELNEITRKTAEGSFISLANGITHYQLSGSQNGTPIVLIHGFSTPYFIFDTTFNFLVQAGFRVLRYDLLGRGYSDRPRTAYNMRLFVNQLKQLLDGLELQPINLVGLSMGGAISAAFTNQYPAYVQRHVLIDPAGAKRISLPITLEALKLPIFGELTLGLLGSGHMIKDIAADMLNQETVAHFQNQYKIQMQYKGFKRALLSTLRNGMLESIYETYAALGKLQKATLIFWGKNDKTIPFENSQTLLQALPHAELHTLEHCGHIPHYEKPHIVNPILLEFLSK